MKCPHCHAHISEFGRFQRKICPTCGKHILTLSKNDTTPRATVTQPSALPDFEAKAPLSLELRTVYCQAFCAVLIALLVISTALMSDFQVPVDFLIIALIPVLGISTCVFWVFLITTYVKRAKKAHSYSFTSVIFRSTFFCFLFVIGIVLLMAGAKNAVYYYTNQESFVRVDAVISRITEEYDSDNDVDYNVYITYTLDGKTYNNVAYPEYSSGMSKGDHLQVLVDPASPEELPEAGIPMLIASVFAICLPVLFFHMAVIKPLKE